MADLLTSQPVNASPAKRALTGAGLVLLAASAVFGANPYGVRDRVVGSVTPEPRPAAVSRVAAGSPGPGQAPAAEPKATVVRSYPWWQQVATLEGEGATTTPSVRIDTEAIQWRVTWTCGSGRLLVRTHQTPRAVVDGVCPGSEPGYSTQKGPLTLEVKAEGPWRLEVEQQIELPLHEPPLPAMAAPGTAALARGDFYRVDQVGDGQVTIYRLGDGTYALRLEDFYVTPNSDLEVMLSPLPAPRTTEEFKSAPAARVVALDVTAGSLNFTVPPGIDPTRYRSVVIWCERLFSAYAAASLAPSPPR